MLRTLVFVSHSSEDAWVARQIAREIRATGAETFLDEDDLDIVDDLEKIREALNNATELLVLATPWALTRPWVWTEIGGAWIRGIPFAVVLHGLTREEFMERPETPAYLKTRNFIGINSIDNYFGELKRRVDGG